MQKLMEINYCQKKKQSQSWPSVANANAKPIAPDDTMVRESQFMDSVTWNIKKSI